MRNKRGDLVGGVILVILGLFFAAARMFPGLGRIVSIELTWPLIVVAVGLALLVLALVLSTPEMAVPACIVMGVGGLLFYQNASGNWASWSYAWALIPGFAGVGVILSNLLGGKEPIADGVRTILVSLVMFAIFGAFFGAFGFLSSLWPVLLILLGLFLLGQGLLRRNR